MKYINLINSIIAITLFTPLSFLVYSFKYGLAEGAETASSNFNQIKELLIFFRSKKLLNSTNKYWELRDHIISKTKSGEISELVNDTLLHTTNDLDKLNKLSAYYIQGNQLLIPFVKIKHKSFYHDEYRDLKQSIDTQ